MKKGMDKCKGGDVKSSKLKKQKFKNLFEIEQFESFSDLQYCELFLPRFLSSIPTIKNRVSIERYYLKISGLCKSIQRCKNALIKLIRCSNEIIEESTLDVINTVENVRQWVVGIPNLFKDLLEEVKGVESLYLPNEFKIRITKAIKVAEDLVYRIFPKWTSKWEKDDLTEENTSDDEL